MKRAICLSAALFLGFQSATAVAQGDVFLEDEGYEEIIVYGDGFQRWDDTWWYVETELVFPQAIMLHAKENSSFKAMALQMRLVYHCEKTWPMGRKKHEVDCIIDDASFKAQAYGKNPKNVVEVLEEMDATVTKAKLQIQVTNDGRVSNIDLEGVEGRNQRENNILETIRSILSRSFSGFHMRLRKINPLNTGQWVEYDSPIMKMPSVTATTGSSMLVHQLDEYKGHHVVQSVGRGSIGLVESGGDNPDMYRADFNGVSIYDDNNGVMTERVWSLIAQPSGSSYVATFGTPSSFKNRGRLRRLQPDEYISVGATEWVKGEGQEFEDLDVELNTWIPLE